MSTTDKTTLVALPPGPWRVIPAPAQAPAQPGSCSCVVDAAGDLILWIIPDREFGPLLGIDDRIHPAIEALPELVAAARDLVMHSGVIRECSQTVARAVLRLSDVLEKIDGTTSAPEGETP